MKISLPEPGFKKDDKKVSGKHGGILFILALILGLFPVYQLRAAEVASLNDEGDGSLRLLVADAVSGETITFSQVGTITLTFPAMIDKDIVIVGRINN